MAGQEGDARTARWLVGLTVVAVLVAVLGMVVVYVLAGGA
jgi:hypothetical protein